MRYCTLRCVYADDVSVCVGLSCVLVCVPVNVSICPRLRQVCVCLWPLVSRSLSPHSEQLASFFDLFQQGRATQALELIETLRLFQSDQPNAPATSVVRVPSCEPPL